MNFRGLPVMGYHGCDAAIATDVVQGRTRFNKSSNRYDWLGEGVYFWIGSFRRAEQWAQDKFLRGKIASPDVICAVLDLTNCLALTDFGMSDVLRVAHSHLDVLCKAAGRAMPINTFYNRELDRAVIDTLHVLRQHEGLTPYDSVLGAFEEGPEVFPNSRIRTKSHIQIAVRNLDSILETFKL